MRCGLRCLAACSLTLSLTITGCATGEPAAQESSVAAKAAAEEKVEDATETKDVEVTPVAQEPQQEQASAGEDTSAAPAGVTAASRDELFELLATYDQKFLDESSLKDIYHVDIEGISLNLPCKMSELISKGFTLEPPKGFSGAYYRTPDEMPKEGERALFDVFFGKRFISVYAVADGASSFEDSLVVGIDYQLTYKDPDERLDVTFSGKITQDSSVEDVLSALGAPLSAEAYDNDGVATVRSLIYSATGLKERLADITEAKAADEKAEKEAQEKRDQGKFVINVSTSTIALDMKVYKIEDDWDFVEIHFTSEGAIDRITLVNPTS